MSLINEYLKKNRTTGSAAEVPPVIKNSPPGIETGSTRKKVSPKTIILLIIMVLMGAVAYYMTMPPATPNYNQTATDSGDYPEPEPAAAPAAAPRQRQPEIPPARSSAANKTLKHIRATTPLKKTETAAPARMQQPAVATPESGRVSATVTNSTGNESENLSENANPTTPLVRVVTRDEREQLPQAPVRRKAEAEDLNHLYQVGVLALNSGNSSRAAYYFERVLKLDQKHHEARLDLAVIHLRQNNFKKAQTLLAEAARNHPRDARVKINLGLIELKQKNYGKAEELFNAALKLDPGATSALNNLAWLAKQRGDKTAVAHYYRNLIALNSQDLKTLLAYASLCEQNQDLTQALSLYRQALDNHRLKDNRRLANRIRKRIKLLSGYVE